MSINHKVVWSEGLFLQPQHLQQQERYIESLITSRPNTTGLYNWGITELEIDSNLLPLGKIALLKCKGIFPDGTAFNIPGEECAPTPIEIPIGMTNSIIYLALPLRRQGLAEVESINEEGNFYRYYCEAAEVSDSNADSDAVTQMQIAKLALRLLSEQDDLNGYSYLPIAKIIEVSASKLIKLDDTFLPSCLDIQALPFFVNFTNELLGLLHCRGEILAEQHLEIMDYLLLQIINRAEMLVSFFTSRCGIHPEILYINLIQLIGELSTYTNKNKRPPKLPEYNHSDLQNTFLPIIAELRKALSLAMEQNVIPLKLELRNHGIWVWPIFDKNLLQNSSFILAVKASIPQESLKNQLISQVKIAPVENINFLISKALSGIDLQTLAVIPKQAPYYSGFVYFMLNKSHAYWKDLSSSAGIAMHIGNQFPNLELQFLALKESK
jgi:type VI secretion protein, VC_A0114 family